MIGYKDKQDSFLIEWADSCIFQSKYEAGSSAKALRESQGGRCCSPSPSPLLTTARMTMRYKFQTVQGMRKKKEKDKRR
jgi:hypothetical protein